MSVDPIAPDDEVSEAVAEVLRQAAQYLQGCGEPPDWDALSPEDSAAADDLLPAIVELVGDRIVGTE